MEKKNSNSFPMLPPTHWWTLRERFKQSIPGVVTDTYLAATLDMQAQSARANVLPYLKDIGLIDNDGKTNQELAKAWRDDQGYTEVCKRIREDIYPSELLSAVPNPTQDEDAARRWFANHTGFGAAAVGRMLRFYTLLCEADVAKRPDLKEKSSKKTAEPTRSTRRTEKTGKKLSVKKPTDKVASSGDKTEHDVGNGIQPNPPGININLEIHISSDATPDQIDSIFESMAKHIYRK